MEKVLKVSNGEGEPRHFQIYGMEFDGSWSLDSRGFEKMESGINGRAIDFAKFGRLYLSNGNWDGTQVLSADWVAQSTRPDTSPDSLFKGDRYYGLMWEGRRRGESEYDFDAEGHYG